MFAWKQTGCGHALQSNSGTSPLGQCLFSGSIETAEVVSVIRGGKGGRKRIVSLLWFLFSTTLDIALLWIAEAG